ncbi:unnamed protein product [Protopolystoma xenopodis]|uniref:Uncharacterized protein n=1 Tax=Protopolystoma xenopodis TaxID=117903 RepID=A0A3S5AVW5_9PLAT|nr:unnamed protein product [Protopolystoma xenopodis]
MTLPGLSMDLNKVSTEKSNKVPEKPDHESQILCCERHPENLKREFDASFKAKATPTDSQGKLCGPVDVVNRTKLFFFDPVSRAKMGPAVVFTGCPTPKTFVSECHKVIWLFLSLLLKSAFLTPIPKQKSGPLVATIQYPWDNSWIRSPAPPNMWPQVTHSICACPVSSSKASRSSTTRSTKPVCPSKTPTGST